jgi:hypothetical protein
MALDTEVHTKYFPDSSDLDWVLYALWLHISQVGAVGNAVIRIVNDGVDDAIMTGGVLGATPSAATDFQTDDFVCIEPVEEYPGGGRWQCLFYRGGSYVYYILAPDGGWDSVAYGAPASGNNYGFGSGVNPDPVITTNLHPEALSGTVPSTGSVRLSSCNRDVYNGSDFYTYFRFLCVDYGRDPELLGFRIGGYIPSDPTSDTKPICGLARIAQADDSSDHWGYDTPGTANQNRAPLEYAHTSQMNGVGYCALRRDGLNFLSEGTTRSGQIYTQSPFLVSPDDASFLGVFGIYDMRVIDGSLPDGSIDAFPAGYFSSDHMLFRWAP